MKMVAQIKRIGVAWGFLCLLLVGIPMAATAQSAAFTVARLVTCEDVQDRAPVNVTEVFPAGTETVFCFLEARDIAQPTEVKMVWYHGEQEMAQVPLTIGQGPRWRTYTSKKTMGMKGNWKVYLVDLTDNTLASVQFVIE
jgi:hypothetical protein